MTAVAPIKQYSNTAKLLRLFSDGLWHSSINMVEECGYKAQARMHELTKKGVLFDSRTPEWDDTKRFLEFRLIVVPESLFIEDGETRFGNPYENKGGTITMSMKAPAPSQGIYREVIKSYDEKLAFIAFTEECTRRHENKGSKTKPEVGFFGKFKRNIFG